MMNENEMRDYNAQEDIFVECKELEAETLTRGKKGSSAPVKKAAKFLAGVMCTALLAGASFAAGTAVGGKIADAKIQKEAGSDLLEADGRNSGIQILDALPMSTVNLTTNSESKQYYSVREIAEKCVSSVVAITTKTKAEVNDWFGRKQQYESEGAGSGIIVAVTEDEMIIATNNHVIENSTTLTVCFNDNKDQIYDGYVKGMDASKDLAVVGVKLSNIPQDVLKTLTVATLGNSDECAMGDQVVAIGNALGYGQTLTSGYISALNREVTVDGVTYTLIQTDAAINPGNSGGALFNMKGEVIGINSVKFVSSEVEGVGYAIPISKAAPVLNNLAEREAREAVAEEEQGYLGVSGTSVTSAMASYYNMPAGFYVSDVEAGSAADLAGVKKGDILTSLDGMSVTTSQQLKNYMTFYRKGEKIEIIVKRLSEGTYEAKILTVTLGEKPATLSEDSTSGQNSNGKSFWGNFGFPGW